MSDASPPDDLDIARGASLRPVEEIAASLDLPASAVDRHGDHVGKLSMATVRETPRRPERGSLVLVTGMTPTASGEGKTVTTVGLGQALAALGERAAVAIREPSLGPVLGNKGGAAGGGRSQVLPMEAINLHFTGDLHAITAAHNLLAAALDAHLHHGKSPSPDVRSITWPRALDVNDRALRGLVVGLGGPGDGVPRESSFLITAASELMAVLCLAEGPADLNERIGRIVVGRTRAGEPVTVEDLDVAGAVAALLRDALRPNLVQTLEGVPALVHGGPFANIAHGTNSAIADRVALDRADYLVTEAGFGADLGAEKFVNIVARTTGLAPDAAVVVVTVRGLKRHGLGLGPRDLEGLAAPDPDAAVEGLENVRAHLAILDRLGVPAVVAINRFPSDTDGELRAVEAALEADGGPAAVSTVHRDGGAGGERLANLVREAARAGADVRPTYDVEEPVEAKLSAIATELYGADGVSLSETAAEDVAWLEDHGHADLPLCVAKTPYSLSDDPTATGRPTGWELSVRSIRLSAGAGFLVALTGDVLTMPGMGPTSGATRIELDESGEIVGLT